MIVKNIDIVNSIQGLREIAEKEMPYKTTLKFSKNIKRIEDLISEYNEEYRKLADEYLAKDDNGNFVQTEEGKGFLIKDGKGKEYAEKLTTLNEFENDVDLYLINSDELEDIAISPRLLMQIDFMIDDSDILD